MKRSKIAGGITFPVFVTAWSIVLVFVVGHFRTADATLLRQTTDADEAPVVCNTPGNVNLALAVPLRGSPAGHLHKAGMLEKGAVAPRATHKRLDLESTEGERRVVPEVVPEKKFNKVPKKRKIQRPVKYSGRISVVEARAAMAAGRADLAYAMMIRGVGEARGDSKYLGVLAVAALKVERHAEAKLIYRRLVALEPDVGRWWAGLALSNERLGLDSAPAYLRLMALSGAGSRLGNLARKRLGVG